jgi:ubiquinone/menaquinone biosynthesis C-methylase UbiE
LVVFRPDRIDRELLELRTVEDVFLLAWGSDGLTYRAKDLDFIEKWTATKPDWAKLLALHHAVHPKPKGTPGYWLVVQQAGKHVYQRQSARQALARGLGKTIHPKWRFVEENADIEFWLTIEGTQAICGLRLSTREMRHRTWKREHRAASLRPVVAAGMAWQADLQAGMVVLDPMCGAGTLLGEARLMLQAHGRGKLQLMGGDVDLDAIESARLNLRSLGGGEFFRWDARKLPVAEHCVDRILCNLPFGITYGVGEDLGALYTRSFREMRRVLKSHGLAVVLTSEAAIARESAPAARMKPVASCRVRILGQPATILTLRHDHTGGRGSNGKPHIDMPALLLGFEASQPCTRRQKGALPQMR